MTTDSPAPSPATRWSRTTSRLRTALGALALTALVCGLPFYITFSPSWEDRAYEFQHERGDLRVRVVESHGRVCAELRQENRHARSVHRWTSRGMDCAWPPVTGGDGWLAGGQAYQVLDSGLTSGVTPDWLFYGVVPDAAGAVEDERWSAVLVKTAEGETPHLRARGVDVEVGKLWTEQVLDRPRSRFVPGEYEVGLVRLPGTVQPMFFGLLPAAAARVEVVPVDGREKAAAIPVGIRSGGGAAGPYVLEPAPGSPATWQDRDSVTIYVHDDKGERLLPEQPK